MIRRAFLLPILVVLSSCGPKPATTEAAEPSTPAASSTAAADDKPPEDPAALKERQRSEFMTGCQKSPELKPFCDCSFDVIVETLTPEELGTEKISPERMEALKSATNERCTEKLPEEALRASFMTGCNSRSANLGGFCECSWTELRKTNSPAQIAKLEGPQLKQVAAVCIGKIPKKQLEEDLKSGFMTGCVKKPEVQKFCECAWKSWRAVMSPVDMVLEGPKSEKTHAAVEGARNKCIKLVPKQDGAAPAPAP